MPKYKVLKHLIFWLYFYSIGEIEKLYSPINRKVFMHTDLFLIFLSLNGKMFLTNEEGENEKKHI